MAQSGKKAADYMEIFTAAGLSALLQVIAIDLVLAGDNAIVIGLAAAGLPADQRKKAILVGIAAATVLRIIFALITQQLLQIGPILLIAGGLLLLYVCWKMWRELSTSHEEEHEATEALAGTDYNKDGTVARSTKGGRKTFAQAAWQIVIADVSMSLDNVLAVAGAAMDHPTVLVIGLALSIALMGFAASFIARLLHKYRWIAYVGLLVILYVAIEMTLKGAYGQWPEHLSILGAWFGEPGVMGH
nr:integral membrane protein TerC [uncultured bacterium]